jgi:hypothetical protein
LVGDNLLLRNFGPYEIMMMCYNRCHGNAVKGFGVLWDNIYDCVFTALDFPVILDGQFTSRPVLWCRTNLLGSEYEIRFSSAFVNRSHIGILTLAVTLENNAQNF